VVIWFCAKESEERDSWRYFFIGLCTVAQSISRLDLWQNPAFEAYRRFYNVLAKLEDGVLQQSETFHRYHDDWMRRADAPYVVFRPEESWVNLKNPLHVADKESTSAVEVWRSGWDDRVRDLERILFEQYSITRRLRTTHPQIAHPHVAVHHWITRSGLSRDEEIHRLKSSLAALVA
jgi:hypothetical protein